MHQNQLIYPKESISFTTNRLTIREFSQNDLEALLAYKKQQGMLQFENGIPDGDTAEKYIKNAIQCAKEIPRTNYYLAITISPVDEVIGRVSLTSQNPSINEWEIGWSIQMDGWGKGYAPEAAHQILEFAFRNLRIHRVVAFCHTGNSKSVKVMEKIGMTRDGYLRQACWFKESWADVFVKQFLMLNFSGMIVKAFQIYCSISSEICEWR